MKRKRVRVTANGKLRKRSRVNDGGGLYFNDRDVETFSSGCALLDCALGGGWAEGRILNVVGDKSTGKTLLAIESAANFARKHPDGKIEYDETEDAFDESYAQRVGLPENNMNLRRDTHTVEDVHKHLEEIIDAAGKHKEPTLYVLDSLDAVSDKAELDRKIDDKATYGMQKAKKLSELFRRSTKRLAQNNVTVMVVSQVRDKIGIAFGERHSRSGGRALDFYASQIVWLAKLGTNHGTRKGMKRAVSVNIKAQVKKNKIGPPFRDCEFPIVFAYGVDDVTAGVNFLMQADALSAIGLSSKAEATKYLNGMRKWTHYDLLQERRNVSEAVVEVWAEVERRFEPKLRKY